MAKAIWITCLIFLTTFSALGQHTISGKVLTGKGEGVEGVSIALQGSYEGTTSLKDGSYLFQVSDTGHYVLVFSMTGYKTREQEVHLRETDLVVNVILKEAITDLKAVVITAGTFEAGDKKRTTVLKSVDMVTTAGQQADIVAALRTLPGAQQVGEQEGLFVRGGTGSETRVFIDGMMVTNPFFSSVPGIAQRSRFSPLLFKGTAFSSGGYSAQFGQGLSSALILESIDLPSRSEVNMILSSPQVSILSQKLTKAKNASLGMNVNYMNLAPYFSVVKQKYHYTKSPEALNTEVNYRKKTKSGLLKFYAYAGTNEVGFERSGLNVEGSLESFRIKNYNAFTTITYTSRLANNWQVYGGGSFSYNKDNVALRTEDKDTTYFTFSPNLTNRTLQSKVVFTKNFSGLSRLYIGSEFQDIRDGIEAPDSIKFRKIDDQYLAGFIETDIYYSGRLVSKAGVRFEYSSLLRDATVSPRVSLAYKVSDQSQFSFAYGMFYQKPETPYLLRRTQLQPTKATHLILNYQKVHDGKTLRIESFYKCYEDLITLHGNNPFDIRNEGEGYAKGVEVFWRDKKSVPHLDYWISYSFLDTKRKYLDYPSVTQPTFAARHTANIVVKRWVEALSTQFSATYSFASGRPYFNPNRPAKDNMRDRTPAYHSLGLQANYLKTFGSVNAVFIINVGNALGNPQVFSYRYADRPNVTGVYKSEAVTPMAKRFIFLGAYLSIGADRRKTILD